MMSPVSRLSMYHALCFLHSNPNPIKFPPIPLRRYSSYSLRQPRSELSFTVGTHLIPHPAKVHTGGEDAFFVSSRNGGVLAIADGVSGWAERGVNPAMFSRELMANASHIVMDEEVNCNPQMLLMKAHAATSSIGSATAIVAMLEKNGVLNIANVGDCGLRIIRKGLLIFSTSPQEHYFNCPFQLSSEKTGQTYHDAMVQNFIFTSPFSNFFYAVSPDPTFIGHTSMIRPTHVLYMNSPSIYSSISVLTDMINILNHDCRNNPSFF